MRHCLHYCILSEKLEYAMKVVVGTPHLQNRFGRVRFIGDRHELAKVGRQSSMCGVQPGGIRISMSQVIGHMVTRKPHDFV